MKEAGYKAAPWVYDMVKSGTTSFYTTENGTLNYYNIPSKAQKKVAGMENFIVLDHIRDNNIIWSYTANNEIARAQKYGYNIFDVSENILGDVNFDNQVNIVDIVILVNFIIGETMPSDEEFIAADLNDDGIINVIDIIQIVNMILN